MTARPTEPAAVGGYPHLVADDISQIVYRSWDEIFGLPRQEAEIYQLRAARGRLEQLLPHVAALKDLVEQAGVSRIEKLDDLIPLLFNHTTYKSYPISLLENNRFDMLTRWLQRMTVVDLSSIDASRCGGVDEWMTLLETKTSLQIFHTTGTTGKLSFIPRTTLETDFWNHIYLSSYAGLSSEAGIKFGSDNKLRLPVIYPSTRNGRYMTQRIVRFLAENVAPTPEECYTLSNGTLSADLVSLSGRIRVAQAKGELSKMKLSESQRVALKRYIEEQARRPQETAEFFGRMIDKLRGQRVFLFGQTSYLVQAAQEGLARGLRDVFSNDSIATTGGGGKDLVLPPDWMELIRSFTGIQRWHLQYAMTELSGVMPCCPQGYYHIPPYLIPFLLDPETGAPLPRTGRQTGRFAAMDLLAQNYWGGVITGDKITIEWDRDCTCGRKGVHIHQDIGRYTTDVTGDDKITCAATVDNTDAALQNLLAG